MISPKALQGALQSANRSKSPRRVTVGRPKLRRETSALTVNTDVFVDHAEHDTQALAQEPGPIESPASPSSPSPPASIHYADDDVDNAPYALKLAAWQRDVALPGGTPPDMSLCRITTESSGARLMHNAAGQVALMVSDTTSQHNASGLKDLLMFGLTRHATKLGRDVVSGKLTRTRLGGKRVAVRSGTYAFVIDQDNDLLLSLTASPKEGAPAGAHLNLTAGLPVLFAGELTIDDGAVSAFTPMSGSYRTPVSQLPVAQSHPLLQNVTLHAPDSWQGALMGPEGDAKNIG